MKAQDFLEVRKKRCTKILLSLKEQIQELEVLEKLNDICIYVTGSYARFEANIYSDLDLFFLKDGSSEENKISRIDKTMLDAEIIRISRELNFGEFSNDGQYLEMHHISDILLNLGCPEDDYKNHFTARMLLLLESYPIYNKYKYDIMIGQIINSYFRDYHDHDKDFRPIFLVNDIIRYYKTMCLNYEHKRNRPQTDSIAKNKAHLKNLKLKFSRLLTCYATIIALIYKKEVTPKDLLEIVSRTPIEKLKIVDDINHKLVSDILELYRWFLNITDKPTEEVLEWIGKKSNRDDAFKKGRDFHKNIYSLIKDISQESDLMYLMI